MQTIHEYNEKPKVNRPVKVFEITYDIVNKDREFFTVLGLDTKNQVIYREVAHIGALSVTLVHPREIFKTAIVKSCKSIILVHNHPSGNIEPSEEDIKITEEIKKAGDVIGISVIDHIIVGNGYHSMYENGQGVL